MALDLGGIASGASAGSSFGPYGALAGGVLGGLGGLMGGGKQKRAAAAQQAMLQAFLNEASQNYGQRNKDLTEAYSGYTGAGNQANDLLSRLMSGDMSAFTESPDYQFRKSEGLNALDNLASARGISGGNVMRGAEDYASGLASEEFGNFWNRLYGQQGIGLNATGSEQTGLQNNLDTLTTLKGSVLGANVNLQGQKGNLNSDMITSLLGGAGSILGGGSSSYGSLQNMFGGGGGGSFSPSVFNSVNSPSNSAFF